MQFGFKSLDQNRSWNTIGIQFEQILFQLPICSLDGGDGGGDDGGDDGGDGGGEYGSDDGGDDGANTW